MKVGEFFQKYHPWIKEYTEWLDKYYDPTSMGTDEVTNKLDKELPHLVPLHLTLTLIRLNHKRFDFMNREAMISNIPEYDYIIRSKNLDDLVGSPDDWVVFI